MPHNTRRIPHLTSVVHGSLRVIVRKNLLLRGVKDVRRTIDETGGQPVREVISVIRDVVQIARRLAASIPKPQLRLHIDIAALNVAGRRFRLL